MTLQALAKEAMQVQDACNLSGVVHSFSRAMARLHELEPDKGTAFYNTHPVSVLFASKIASLTSCEDLNQFRSAWADCEDLAND